MKRVIPFVIAILTIFILSGCGLDPAYFLSQIFAPDYIEVTIDTSSFKERFYYQQLDEEEQTLYCEIYQGLSEQKDEIVVHSTTGEKANEVLGVVILDSPELFWTEGSATSTAYSETYTIVEPEYNCTREEKESKKQQIEAAADAILAQVPQNANEYEKLKFIYEYLINSIEYVKGAPDNQNIYSALVGKKSVCAGYAKAYQYLIEKLGIECIYVIGTAEGNGSSQEHAWNIVKCNDKFYYTDVTWGDPLFAETEEESKLRPTMLYDYLCCDENALSATHKIKEGYEYPKCDSADLNYYRLNNMFHEKVNESALLKAMYRTIDNKGERTTFKFANSEVYSQAARLIKNELLDKAGRYLARKYGLDEFLCYYGEDAKLYKFTIDWIYE
jgi:hypothetical protein